MLGTIRIRSLTRLPSNTEPRLTEARRERHAQNSRKMPILQAPAADRSRGSPENPAGSLPAA